MRLAGLPLPAKGVQRKAKGQDMCIKGRARGQAMGSQGRVEGQAAMGMKGMVKGKAIGSRARALAKTLGSQGLMEKEPLDTSLLSGRSTPRQMLKGTASSRLLALGRFSRHPRQLLY